MRLLEVTHRYEPRVGGTESHVGEVSRRLAGRGHEVVVLTADRRPDEPREEVIDGVTVRRRESFAPGGKLHLDIGFLGAASGDWDAVHVHNYHSAPAVLTALGGSRGRLVFTPHYHGAGSTRLADLLLAPYSVLGGRALRAADEVVAVSSWEAAVLRRHHGVEATVVPHGLDYGAMEGERPLDIGSEFALVVGRLERYKRATEAAAGAYEAGYDVVVVGEGPDEDRVRSAVPDERALFMPGRLPEAELRGLMRSAAVTVNLSSREAFGMTVGESLARGTPAVVSGDMALSEWAWHEGVVRSEGIDPASVASAVEEAAGLEPDRRPLPDWSEVVDELERILT